MFDGSGVAIDIKGTTFGPFSIEIEKVEGDVVKNTYTFGDLPASPLLTGTVDLAGAEPILRLDTNGDGKLDFSLEHGTDGDPRLYIAIFRKIVIDMKLNKNVEKSVLEELGEIDDALEEYLEKDDEGESQDKMEDVLEEIAEFKEKLLDKKWKKGKITNEQRVNLKLLIEGINF